MDIVDRDKAGRVGFDLVAVGAEMDPIDGLRGGVAGFQTGPGVETDAEREMIDEVLVPTAWQGLLVAVRGKEG